MNFLSHFYFDRYSEDPEHVLGTVLPDLIKNANKNWILHPGKRKELFIHDIKLLRILEGWNRHLKVDKHFHASDFFCEHTRIIRSAIAPLLEDSPVRPSFLSHIALELMLDSLLITEGIVHADDFYRHLMKVDRPALTKFLELNNISDTDIFFQFFDRFIDSAYLKSYSDPHNILYALNRICMRVWEDPLNEIQKVELTGVLLDYQEQLRNSFAGIFHRIDLQLKD